MRRASKEERAHWERVRALGCCICGGPATIHHVHGGSVKHLVSSGMGQRGTGNHWLVIPLAHIYHVGAYGIDYGYGVESWEADFGTQLEHLHWVNDQLPYDLFTKAGIPAIITHESTPKGIES